MCKEGRENEEKQKTNNKEGIIYAKKKDIKKNKNKQ